MLANPRLQKHVGKRYRNPGDQEQPAGQDCNQTADPVADTLRLDV